jgi:Icc protein
MPMERREFLKYLALGGIGLSGMAALGDLFVPFAEAVRVPQFSFAHITDLHLDVRGKSTWQYREKSVTLFIDALRQLGHLQKLDFILFGGDQVHSGPNDRESLTVFQTWVDQLDVPYYILLGNSEVSPVPGSKLGRADYLRAWSGRGLRQGRPSWAFDPAPGVHFIGFDVTVDGKPYGEATPKGLRWLEHELASNRKKKLIIVATHQLLLPTTPLDLTPAWSFWLVKNHAQVRELVERFPNVRLVLSGHHHATRVQTTGRVTYVSDPAIVTYPCAFRIFTVNRNGIYLKNIGLDDRSTVSRARDLLLADPYARMYDPDEPQNVLSYTVGLTEQDRETFIPFESAERSS